MKGFKIKELVPRGFLYPHILMILKKKPMNGYLLIRKIKEITGFWIPSTGSIYPALDYLKRNGFIKIMKKTKKSTIYMLSEKGKAAASEFEHTGNEMKEKITDTFSKVLNINKERLGIVMEQLKKDYTKKGSKAMPLLDTFSEIRELIFNISKNTRNMKDAKMILTNTKIELRKLVR